jgi:uncharacterized membrane protein
MNKNKRLLTVLGLISGAITIGQTPPAQAEITLCNRFDRPIYMALSQKKADRPQAGTIVKGWWYAKPGQCQTVYANNISNGDNYAYYAISADKQRSWTGDSSTAEACIRDRGFDLMNAELSPKQPQCVAPSYPIRFQSIDTKDLKSVNFDIKN